MTDNLSQSTPDEQTGIVVYEPSLPQALDLVATFDGLPGFLATRRLVCADDGSRDYVPCVMPDIAFPILLMKRITLGGSSYHCRHLSTLSN